MKKPAWRPVNMPILLVLLILYFGGRAVSKWNWSKYLGWLLYQAFLMRGRMGGEKPAKAYMLDRSGLWRIPSED